MKTSKWLLPGGFLIGSMVVLCLAVSSRTDPKNEQWVWNCVNGDRCERISAVSSRHGFTIGPFLPIYESLDMCRLTCGSHGALWPRPTISTTLSKEVILFHPRQIQFNIQETVKAKAKQVLLTDMTKTFMRNLGHECGTNCTSSSEAEIFIRISVSTEDLKLSWETDESYTLDISTRGSQVTVQISSVTVFGARHGLETLSQLVASKRSSSSAHRRELAMVGSAQITDRPVYPHRGLLLDTARNFIPVTAIERTLDAMAASKLNVFHWHVTDSQSFPLESTRVPQFTRYGAYSAKEIYRPFEVRHLVQYALERGIRVIMELDAPAHAGNGWQWGVEAGLEQLAICVNQQPWRQFCIQPPCGQLNPANPNVYRVLRDLYRDVFEMLAPGEILHMGGDEVFFACWNSSSEIVDLLESRGYGRNVEDFLQLWAEFQATALRIWDEETGQNPSSRDKRKPPAPVILWTSHLTAPSTIEKYLEKDRYVIQTWTLADSEEPMQLLNKGYRVVMSTKDAWYLDHGFWGTTTYHTWRKAYMNRIPRLPGVLGGEACMWSELVDENSLDSRVWPRAAAVAERLWADPTTDTISAEPRFYRHRERLVSRGIQPEALAPKWCLQNEGLCA